MKITEVEPIPIAVPVRKPLKMAVATVNTRTCILVRLHTDDGTSGIGEGVIAPYFTGETVVSAVHLIREVYAPLLRDVDPGDLQAVGRQLDRAAVANSAARSAVEIALYDLVARSLSVPLYRLFGGIVRGSIPTIWHVSGGEPEADGREAAAAAADGYRLVKVKVGTQQISRDVASVEAVREAVGEDVELLLDANQGWSVDKAIRFARRVEPSDPLLIEQPVHRDDVSGLAEVRRSTRFPVVADEAVFGARGLYTCLRAEAVDGVVAKLIKAGGLAGVRRLTELAETAGIGVHFAGMAGETSVAAAAAVHLAVTLPELRFGGGMGPQYLADDVVTSPLQPVNGHLTPPDEPGLGLELSDEAIERFRVFESA